MQTQSLIPSVPTDMMTVAQTLAKSGYFTDARDASQAFVKILAGAELGIPAFAAMTGIHIISGKPVMGAGLIASIIKRSGKYDYRVTETSESICSIDFYQGAEKIGTSTFTIEQARKAGVKNLDKFAQNMLFARSISNGAKWFTPDVFGGPVYTDGEIEPVYTAPVIEETTAVVVDPSQPARNPYESVADYEARVTAQTAPAKEAPRMGKQELADAMKALTEWQNECMSLLNTADAYNVHLAKLRGLKGIPKEEMVKMFQSHRATAQEVGLEYDEKGKVFCVMESTPAETVEVVE